MQINQPSRESIAFMVDAIINKLRVANAQAINPDAIPLESHEDLYDLYQMVSGKDHFSIMEIEAIVTELGRLR